MHTPFPQVVLMKEEQVVRTCTLQAHFRPGVHMFSETAAGETVCGDLIYGEGRV